MWGSSINKGDIGERGWLSVPFLLKTCTCTVLLVVAREQDRCTPMCTCTLWRGQRTKGQACARQENGQERDHCLYCLCCGSLAQANAPRNGPFEQFGFRPIAKVGPPIHMRDAELQLDLS